MRILHVLDHSIPLHSGYTFRTRYILEYQRALGWQTFHITSAKHNTNTDSVEEIDGFRFYRTPKLNSIISNIPFVNQCAIVTTLAKRLNEVVEEVRPHIIHAHSPALNGLAALWVGKRHGLKVVYECRGFWEDAAVDHGTTIDGSLRYRASHTLETFVFRNVDAVTTICEGLRSDIISRGIPDAKITVIPNAVNITKFKFNNHHDIKFRKDLGITGKRVLGFIGSFYSYEGLQLLLESMPLILLEMPDTCLLLVGGGPNEENLVKLTEKLQLTNNVIFTGRVSHGNIHEYYNQIDIMIYPRYSMRLTNLVTPLKPLEAMAQGRLVLASDVGGHKELIIDGQTGFLFKAGDHYDLASKVLYLFDNPVLCSMIRNDARKFVELKRTWPDSVVRYQNVYFN
ncbi:MAG: glycosyltransferase, exosortase A system-associated [Proteobacteria bacterium]|nr:glycosyltransferase, exosortase A system-associated [Pseudomonadota bacterium]